MIVIQAPGSVAQSYNRIKGYLHVTPLIQSDSLNTILGGHNVYFKVDSLQKTGAFKIRGVLNHLLSLKERNMLPSKVVAYSTGNHGIGLAFAANLLGIHARIYLPENTSRIKGKAAKASGAEVIYTETRSMAEAMAKEDASNGFYYLHPSDSDLSIAGAGTMCYEAITQLGFSPDAIFASCGGGGLLSGSYLAKELSSKTSSLIGCEPLQANDAFKSLKQNSIYKFTDSPDTVADGLRSLAISERSFSYLKKLDGFMLADEYRIYQWTAWLMHLLKVVCEPSAAVSMVCAHDWLKKQTEKKKILVLISGGNIDPSLYRELWNEDYLMSFPE